jgi:hypothetical protein
MGTARVSDARNHLMGRSCSDHARNFSSSSSMLLVELVLLFSPQSFIVVAMLTPHAAKPLFGINFEFFFFWWWTTRSGARPRFLLGRRTTAGSSSSLRGSGGGATTEGTRGISSCRVGSTMRGWSAVNVVPSMLLAPLAPLGGIIVNFVSRPLQGKRLENRKDDMMVVASVSWLWNYEWSRTPLVALSCGGDSCGGEERRRRIVDVNRWACFLVFLFLRWCGVPPPVQVSSVVTNESPSYVRNVLMPPGECSHLTNLHFHANKTDMDHEPPSAPPPSLSNRRSRTRGLICSYGQASSTAWPSFLRNLSSRQWPSSIAETRRH